MSDREPDWIRRRFAQKIADSLAQDFPPITPRYVRGHTALPGKATAVIGMRRAGKTTFLHQLRQDRIASGAARERTPYVNFEDEQLSGLAARDLHLLIEEYYRAYPATRRLQTVMWCFDEIQIVPGWERFVRRLLDSENVEIYVSGSSAALLSREIATAMRGRAWEVVIHPFSFPEYLLHRSRPLPGVSSALVGAERSVIESAFRDYLIRGGFPEAQPLDTGTRRQLLRDYVDVAVLRDVIERHNVSNIAGLHWMVRHLLGNPGASFSVQKFYATLKSQGLAISKDTVHQLLRHLEDCFLVRPVWMETASERQRMVNPRKIYPIDAGLIPVFDRTDRSNLGHALETVVLVELERRGASITYVRTQEGHEVDFLSRHPDGSAELIQVCADASASSTADREIRALEHASADYPRAVKRLLTATQDGLPLDLPRGVIAQPAYEWLLGG